MEPKKHPVLPSVQELRAVFANSQLTGQARSLESLLVPTTDGNDGNVTDNAPGILQETEGQIFDKNMPLRRSLAKPMISPKPKTDQPCSKSAIKGLVASLEGSHGMYSSKHLPSRSTLTFRDLRDNIELSKATENHVQVTSKIIKKETVAFCDKKNELTEEFKAKFKVKETNEVIKDDCKSNSPILEVKMPPCKLGTNPTKPKRKEGIEIKEHSSKCESKIPATGVETAIPTVCNPTKVKVTAKKGREKKNEFSVTCVNNVTELKPVTSKVCTSTQAKFTNKVSIENNTEDFCISKSAIAEVESAPFKDFSPNDKDSTLSQTLRNSVISTDNYVCKQKIKYIRRSVPSKEELGPAPPKPVRHPGMRLPVPLKERNNFVTPSHLPDVDSLPPPVPDRNTNLLNKPLGPVPARPSRPLPRQPSCEEPSPLQSPHEEIEEEEIYNDVIIDSDAERFGREHTFNTVPTGYEDAFEDIYDDHDPQNLTPSLPRYPPPPPPVASLQLYNSGSTINQDYSENEEGEAIYEEAPVGPEYVNKEEVAKEQKKQKKRCLKTEQKTLEKIEKKRDKFKKKFSLSGEEIPLDAGIVKNDSKGNKFDLSVFKGETVLILRMENNPSGKWLAKNEKGKVGYVELNNIQVDVESVKSVMTVRASQNFGEEALSIPVTEEECFID